MRNCEKATYDQQSKRFSGFAPIQSRSTLNRGEIVERVDQLSELSRRKEALKNRIDNAEKRHTARMKAREGEARPELWSLINDAQDFDQERFMKIVKANPKKIEKMIYRPAHLKSKFEPFRFRVKSLTFDQVSFKDTVISDFDFQECTFENCVFIGSIFRNCRFNACRFENCNVFRMELYDCFVDPKQFGKCVPISGNENVGLHLFHELLANSRQQAQPDFADEAQFHFRKWQRYQLRGQLRSPIHSKFSLSNWAKYIGFLLFDWMSGSGMRLRRLFVTSIIALVAIAALNWAFAVEFGLMGKGQGLANFTDALYLSTVIITTLGFGDITPTTDIGRIVISLEAMLGFVLFATFASALYRRFTS